MNFKTIHTVYGLSRMSQAEATGKPINLVAIAVGDGAGNAVTPDQTQTQLVREIAGTRAAPNRIYQDSANPQMFTAELVIPATQGGFTIREIGIFDDAGGLFAVGNVPDMYKPTQDEGAFSDAIISVKFMATNASIVTILVDPNVALATQAWVSNNISIAGLMPGGLFHQVLRKRTNLDGDVEWADPTDVNVVVDTIEEQQTLAANQTVINLLLTNTKGLAIYVNGARLPNKTGTDGWQPDPTILTRAILGQAYAAGAKIIAVQNEPASHLKGALQSDLNLSDLQDPPTARTNLGVYSKDECDRLAPVGEVSFFARAAAPTGWLKANGAAVSRTAYAALFTALGTTYGAGDGFNTFGLPDLRGEFLRALDDGRGIDANRVLGSAQTGQNAAHTHSGSTTTAGSHSHSYTDNQPYNPRPTGLAGGIDAPAVWGQTLSGTTGAAGAHSHSFTTDSNGGTEARPRNVALLACIKF